MNEKKDNIYIYLWEEFKAIYIGRTINPNSRHYQHKHRSAELTYKFSNEHHVEHPKMIIIERDLTINEGLEREKYWIEHYKEGNEYLVLNKTCGGQIGNQKSRNKLTEEEKIKHRKEYYQKNKDRIKEYSKKYNKEHKKKRKYSKEYYKKRYEKDKEKIIDKSRKYRKEHREEILVQRKKYREENREKILEQKRRYREKHREELRLKAKEYMANKRKITK